MTPTIAPEKPIEAAPPDETLVHEARRVGAILTFMWIAHVMVGVYTLPLSLFLKNHLHQKALEVASVMLFVGIAAYVKPILAWICDSFPIGGRRRKPYIIVGGVIEACGFGALLVLPATSTVITVSLGVMSTGLMLMSCALGGLMVEAGNGGRNLAKLSSIRGTIWTGTGVVIGPFAGYMAGLPIRLTWIFCTIFALAPALLALLFKEPVLAWKPQDPLKLIVDPIKALFGQRNFLFAIVAIVLLTLSPGFGTPLLFFQQNVLRFTPQQIGNLGFISGGCAVLTGLLCVRFAKRWSLKWILIGSTLLNAVGTLAYLFYSTYGHAMVIEGIGGLVGAPSQIVIMLIAGYAMPKGFEAVGYSIIMALWNVTMKVSDVWGSYLSDHYRWTIHELVWINAGTTLLILLLVPFMPRYLLDKKDVDHTPDVAADGL